MMDGANDPDCRRGMIFDENFNKDVKETIKNLIKIKHLKAIREGEVNTSKFHNKSLKIQRTLGKDTYTLIVAFEKEDLIDLKGKLNLFNNELFDGTLNPLQILIYKE